MFNVIKVFYRLNSKTLYALNLINLVIVKRYLTFIIFFISISILGQEDLKIVFKVKDINNSKYFEKTNLKGFQYGDSISILKNNNTYRILSVFNSEFSALDSEKRNNYISSFINKDFKNNLLEIVYVFSKTKASNNSWLEYANYNKQFLYFKKTRFSGSINVITDKISAKLNFLNGAMTGEFSFFNKETNKHYGGNIINGKKDADWLTKIKNETTKTEIYNKGEPEYEINYKESKEIIRLFSYDKLKLENNKEETIENKFNFSGNQFKDFFKSYNNINDYFIFQKKKFTGYLQIKTNDKSIDLYFLNGQLHGGWSYVSKNLKFSGEFKNGNKTGEWKVEEKGVLTEVHNYSSYLESKTYFKDDGVPFKKDCFNTLGDIVECKEGYFIDKRDGQIYKYKTFGNYTWMLENLRYTKGSEVRNKFVNEYKWYPNTQNLTNKYAPLYNFYTAKNACPQGWHLPEYRAEFPKDIELQYNGIIINDRGYSSKQDLDKLGYYWLNHPRFNKIGELYTFAAGSYAAAVFAKGNDLSNDGTKTKSGNIYPKHNDDFCSVRCVKDLHKVVDTKLDIKTNLDGTKTAYYMDKLFNGLALKNYENGNKAAELFYIDGNLDGFAQTWFKSGGVMSTGFYKNSKRDSLWIIYDENGYKSEEVVYKDGNVISNTTFKWYPSKEYYTNKNNNCKQIINYKNGVRHGLYQLYYDRNELKYNNKSQVKKGEWGYLKAEGYYINGLLEGNVLGWHKNGNLSTKGNYNNGKQEGLHKFWHENGLLMTESNYHNGELHGETRLYDENGDYVKSYYYKNGKPSTRNTFLKSSE